MKAPYLDTSALAKRYLNEPFSEEFDAYLLGHGGGVITALTVLEMRCLLARRRRAGDIDRRIEGRVFAAFEQDMALGSLEVHAVDDAAWNEGTRLIATLQGIPLRTLDALHLALARSLPVVELATADHTMVRAARALKLKVTTFS